jgi:hypothetical protein
MILMTAVALLEVAEFDLTWHAWRVFWADAVQIMEKERATDW